MTSSTTRLGPRPARAQRTANSAFALLLTSLSASAALLPALVARTAHAQEAEGGDKPKGPMPLNKGVGPARLPTKKGGPLPEKRVGGTPGVKQFPGPAGGDATKVQQQMPNPNPNPAGRPNPKDDETTIITSAGSTEGGAGADLKVAKGKACKPMRPDAKVTFDFKGDINELITLIAKTTCKNFIITNKIRSQKFDIISPTPITVDEAWAAFLSSLEANEFAIFQVGRYYKIIQATDGTRAPVPIYEDGQRFPINDRMVTKIYRLKHASDINAVVNYLNIFKSGKGQIHPFAPTNTVIATDFGTSLDRIERVLEEIDQPGALEQVHVVPVEFAGAQEIAEKLSQVFEPQKAGAGKPGGAPGQAATRIKVRPPGEVPPGMEGMPQAGGEEEGAEVSVSKILADERTNKLIIIASDRAFKQIMALKKELDVPDSGSDSQIQVLRLKHADAEELSSTLASLAQGKPTTPRSSKGLGKGAKGAPNIPQPQPNPGVPGGTGQASLFQGEVKVTADKPTNSLVITASKADYASLKRVIDLLDIARYQVFVEALIMEVSVKRDRQLGLTWHGGIAPVIDGKNSPIIFGNQPTKDFNSIALSTNPLLLTSILGFAGAARGPTLTGSESIVQGGIPSIGVVIQALQTTNDVNVVSTPHLLTLDNEEAEIQVSEKRPFPSGISLGGLGGLGSLGSLAGGANTGALGGLGALGTLGGLGSMSFNREDVGLTLKLKPQISDEDNVRLQIDQELSDVAGTDAATNQTITAKRAVKNVVVVRNQDSVVIGGLVRDRETVSESKTPLFGDLPLIGWLFKRQVKSVEKVNLLLVLTPYIIRGPQDFRVIFERKMAERKEFVDRFHGAVKSIEADIDWTRKRGPVANYRLNMRREMQKAENEGPGSPDEKVIRPNEDKDHDKLKDKDHEGTVITVPPSSSNEGQEPQQPQPELQPQE